MSPGLARYFAFSGKASSALSVSLCAEAIAERLSPAFTVTVTIGGRRIAFARAMTSPTHASRVGRRPGADARLTLLRSLWPMDGAAVDRQAGRLGHRGDRVAQNCL